MPKPTKGEEFQEITEGEWRGDAQTGANITEPAAKDRGERGALPVVNAASLAERVVPERQEHVQGIVPANNVTLLMGDGATGKSLLSLQLCVSTAMRMPWLGNDVIGGNAVFLTAEDDIDEVHRRLDDICAGMRIDMADLSALDVVPLAGEDAVLAFAEGRGGIIKTTPLFKRLEALIAKHEPCLLVLDTLADLFGGDENVRSQARQFIGLLRGLAMKHNVTVVVLGHPSLSGMASGSGSSGTTGWSNSVRSRLYFERVQVRDGDRIAEPDPDIRVLRLMKANYGRGGIELRLKWQAGLFRLVPGSGMGVDATLQAAHAERVFLDLLDAYAAQGRHVTAVPSGNYAPTVFSRDEKCAGLSRHAFHGAMSRLFNAGTIKVETFGPPSKPRTRIVRKEEPSGGGE